MDSLIVFKIYMKEIKDLKKGDKIIVDCPKCKGKLYISKSNYNGHLHIFCENKDLIIMQ